MPDFSLCKYALHTLNRRVNKKLSITLYVMYAYKSSQRIRSECVAISFTRSTAAGSHFSFLLLGYSIESKMRSFHFHWRGWGIFFSHQIARAPQKSVKTIIILLHGLYICSNCRQIADALSNLCAKWARSVEQKSKMFVRTNGRNIKGAICSDAWRTPLVNTSTERNVIL